MLIVSTCLQDNSSTGKAGEPEIPGVAEGQAQGNVFYSCGLLQGHHSQHSYKQTQCGLVPGTPTYEYTQPQCRY